MSDRSLAKALKVRVEKDDFLFKEGDASRDLYVIQFGAIRIFKTEAGVEIDLAKAGPGEVVGEVAAIDGGVRSATGIALETTEVLVIPVEDFKRILGGIPDWFRRIAGILVHRLREVDASIHRTMGGDSTPQIAALVSLMTYHPNANSESGGYSISQKDLENELVDVLQLQLSDVTASLGQLRTKGLIELAKGKVIVKDRGKLEELGSSVYRQDETTPAT
ncbi:MAG: cyclic nucleotide-binding domain-containing protein [Chitinivibrionales bacterium]|nr:cyclic nucleotide-binding domain-containing protein [Chitinivibrionales bacterium]MBD3394481.1 cyclic nucleotide-binding domain-containing protein [Chitinivibrionales bacterium]